MRGGVRGERKTKECEGRWKGQGKVSRAGGGGGISLGYGIMRLHM